MYRVTPGTTSKLIEIGLLTIDGDEYASLAYNTSGLACAYLRAGATAWVSVTLADMTLGTWVSGGFKAIGNGVYQFGIPNAAIASGADWVVVRFSGASGLETTRYLVMLDVATGTVPAALLATTNGSDTVGTQLGRLDATVGSRLAPTTAGRTLDVSDTGEAGVDLSNIKQATGATTLTNITVPVVTTLTNLPSGLASAVVTALGGSTIEYTGPVATDGSLTLYQGDSYEDGNAMEWTITNYSGPSLDGLAVTLGLVRKAVYERAGFTTPDASWDGTSAQSGTTVTITVEATDAETLALPTPSTDADNYRLQIRVDSLLKTIVEADATVVKRVLA